MNKYVVNGPYKVQKCKDGKNIDFDGFWKNNEELKSIQTEKGIYVFAIKTSKTKKHTPYYIGRTKRTFDSEVFSDRNKLKYIKAVNNYERGYPVLFFVSYPQGKKGQINRKEINEIETFLIKLGAAINKNIENDRKIKGYNWEISGVVNSSKRQKKSEILFSDTFDLSRE